MWCLVGRCRACSCSAACHCCPCRGCSHLLPVLPPCSLLCGFPSSYDRTCVILCQLILNNMFICMCIYIYIHTCIQNELIWNGFVLPSIVVYGFQTCCRTNLNWTHPILHLMLFLTVLVEILRQALPRPGDNPARLLKWLFEVDQLAPKAVKVAGIAEAIWIHM